MAATDWATWGEACPTTPTMPSARSPTSPAWRAESNASARATFRADKRIRVATARLSLGRMMYSPLLSGRPEELRMILEGVVERSIDLDLHLLVDMDVEIDDNRLVGRLDLHCRLTGDDREHPQRQHQPDESHGLAPGCGFSLRTASSGLAKDCSDHRAILSRLPEKPRFSSIDFPL